MPKVPGRGHNSAEASDARDEFAHLAAIAELLWPALRDAERALRAAGVARLPTRMELEREQSGAARQAVLGALGRGLDPDNHEPLTSYAVRRAEERAAALADAQAGRPSSEQVRDAVRRVAWCVEAARERDRAWAEGLRPAELRKRLLRVAAAAAVLGESLDDLNEYGQAMLAARQGGGALLSIGEVRRLVDSPAAIAELAKHAAWLVGPAERWDASAPPDLHGPAGEEFRPEVWLVFDCAHLVADLAPWRPSTSPDGKFNQLCSLIFELKARRPGGNLARAIREGLRLFRRLRP